MHPQIREQTAVHRSTDLRRETAQPPQPPKHTSAPAGEYMAHTPGWLGKHRAVRFLVRFNGALLAFLLLPVAVGVVGAKATFGSLYAPRGQVATSASAPGAVAAPPAHDPAKPTAAILIGPRGANAADTLAPYEVLATTGAFNVYTVAPERRPMPLTGGLDLAPTSPSPNWTRDSARPAPRTSWSSLTCPRPDRWSRGSSGTGSGSRTTAACC